MKSHRGLSMSRKLKCRQPSRQVRKCGGTLNPVGHRVGAIVAGWHDIFRRDPEPVGSHGRGDQHLARKFHSRSVKIESLDSFTIERTQAAMEIAYLYVEEQSSEKAEDRVPQIAVQEWHGARRYPASKSIAHDDVITFPEPRHEQPQIRQVVTVIGVPHDDIATARRRDAIPKR